MVTEDYVSFETAKLLKEKGFDWDCKQVYDLVRPQSCTDGKIYDNFPDKNPNAYSELVSAPTLQMAMKWLREVHSLFPVVEPFLTEETKPKYWVYVIWHNSIPKYMQSKLNYYTPEEACEEAIRYCLKNLI